MARMHLSAARSGIPGALLAVFIPAQTYAQEQEGPAREAAATAPDTLATMLTLGVGLLAVIAIIFGCAWIVRRMSGMTGGNTRAIKVVSVMPMGTRERIALVEVGDKQILIGVTPSPFVRCMCLMNRWSAPVSLCPVTSPVSYKA